ncbi:MAG: heme ABC exporter ATP-binding protein CcmA, partial [Deinococcota bacterium]|nr:heme ABC exporter ATP-binding protein CcmA [Deinococcota bacterium]
MSGAAVELKGLSRRYGHLYILKEINLSVGRGKTVALVGGNGAGKTTLLRVLATTLRPSRGSGKVFGFDLSSEAPEVRKRVAYLGVLGGSYGALTATENLRLAATLYGKDASHGRLAALLRRVGLQGAKDKPARVFSSGMKKRLALARLLLADAPLLLLDEPYAALDESGKGLIDEVLAEAKLQEKTVVMASHELERITPLTDSVLQLQEGRLSLAGAAFRGVKDMLEDGVAGDGVAGDGVA